ncbi:MAG: ACP S-malonyltransferase [Puniceicoccales bacterium]|jgi:[acyl-carrier-protein] S-malonyltransferase|nr:ACP S-malonyltransferase [Puniceicoccales bacterium]
MPKVLLFPGQGSQVVGMGRSFYQQSPLARQYFDWADQYLPFSLTKICFDGPEDLLKETRVCQPALYVLGYIIFACLKEKNYCEKGIACACGLSLGELTALAVAEVFDFKTGLHLVAERGRLMQEACALVPTGMLSLIGGNLEATERLCQSLDLDIANLNCPGQIVVSGTLDALDKAQIRAKDLGFKLAIPLKVAGAYHSRWMQPAREHFEKILVPISFNPPVITVLTNTTGDAIADPEQIKQALGKQITSTVQWESCLRWLVNKHCTHCLECGPGNVLAGLAKRTNPMLQVTSLSEWEHVLSLIR